MSEDFVEKRRNGIYTCLDCESSKTESCSKCHNWDGFVLDETVSRMSYKEKDLHFLNKKGTS